MAIIELAGFFALADGYVQPVLTFVLTLIVTVVIAKILGMFLTRTFRRYSKKLKMDEAEFFLIRRIAVIMVYFFGLLIAFSEIPGFEALWVSIFASAGIIAIVVGLAAQQTFSNIMAGVFLAMFHPFRTGDRVRVEGEYGTIEDITLRHTVIKSWDNRRIIIPNAKMNEESIINYTAVDPSIMGTVEIGISYDSDIDLAKKIMLEEALAHPDIHVPKKESEHTAKDQSAVARVVECGDYSIKMRIYFWAPNQPKARRMKFELTESIKKRFDREGVEIPFPYRTLVYKKDLPKPKHPGIPKGKGN